MKIIVKKRSFVRKNTLKILKILKNMGIFTLSEAKHRGVSQPTISRLCKKKLIIRVRKGLYVEAYCKLDPRYYDYAAACRHFGDKSIIGGLSALFYHGLIDKAPTRIWVIVPYEKKSINTIYKCIRTNTPPHVGIERDTRYFKITNIERTLVECLKYKNKIGFSFVIKAIRDAIANKKTNIYSIGKTGKAMGLQNVIEKYWDIIIA